MILINASAHNRSDILVLSQQMKETGKDLYREEDSFIACSIPDDKGDVFIDYLLGIAFTMPRHHQTAYSFIALRVVNVDDILECNRSYDIPADILLSAYARNVRTSLYNLFFQREPAISTYNGGFYFRFWVKQDSNIKEFNSWNLVQVGNFDLKSLYPYGLKYQVKGIYNTVLIDRLQQLTNNQPVKHNSFYLTKMANERHSHFKLYNLVAIAENEKKELYDYANYYALTGHEFSVVCKIPSFGYYGGSDYAIIEGKNIVLLKKVDWDSKRKMQTYFDDVSIGHRGHNNEHYVIEVAAAKELEKILLNNIPGYDGSCKVVVSSSSLPEPFCDPALDRVTQSKIEKFLLLHTRQNEYMPYDPFAEIPGPEEYFLSSVKIENILPELDVITKCRVVSVTKRRQESINVNEIKKRGIFVQSAEILDYLKILDTIEITIPGVEKGRLENLLQNYSLGKHGYYVKISGELNGSDINSLRDWTIKITESQGFVTTLDLSECRIVQGGDSYGSYHFHYSDVTLYTEDDIVGNDFFKDFIVRRIVVPIVCREIGHYAFSSVIGLQQIECPGCIEKVSSYAFAQLDIEELNLDCIELNRESIYYCRKLKRVHLSSNINKIAAGSFYLCDSLEEISLPPGNKKFYTDQGILYGAKGKKIICVSNKLIETFEVPDIVKTIEPSAFYGLSNLSYVKMKEGVTKIGDLAFASTSLESIEIPSSVSMIGKNAFYNCVDLKDIYVYSATPIPVSIGTFNTIYETVIVHVPKGCIDNYKKKWPIKNFVEEDYNARRVGEIENHLSRALTYMKGREEVRKMGIQFINSIESPTGVPSLGNRSIVDVLNSDEFYFISAMVKYSKIDMEDSVIHELEKRCPERRINIIKRLKGLMRWKEEMARAMENYRRDEIEALIERQRLEDDIESGWITAFEGDPEAEWNID